MNKLFQYFFFCMTTTTAVGDVEEIEIIHLRAVL